MKRHTQRNGRLLPLGTGLTAAALAAVVLTGCGHSGQGVADPAAPPSPSPSAPGTPSASANPPGGKVTKEAIAAPVKTGRDDRTLTVGAEEGGCRTARLTTRETATRVTLTLELADHHKPGSVCPDIARMRQVSVTLKAPLDGRELIDGATGHQLAAPGRS
ncbi:MULTISPECIES: hypothetical protein [Streptomycetaceae]|uniref:Uncharacterized protein n=1 Tax=Streptantibioticus cattleyicolor (strain ATCC 35852 / DSM 46488 / JCM 4925 / NBRC 14057 / NRRL 8057) TaxID=1003195 RepID=F8JZH3_STREN|nr:MULTISPECIES: hypothetical protein [Streptomycetaceae]AEW97274.1 hypothetical protein SCATT_49030 [Streptantibioticus cattleyicolor NRRL 8057 = DSM 46488]MYS61727.1 hypothetical protein [Streptomyces sp. SID5468]CCB77595.1 exported protein of unknown function [Streptantibioticus cattleyicolor NRRL 8057 = DSM 46488]